MVRFSTDSIVPCCSNVGAAEKWWIDIFGCKRTTEASDWDDPRPSDVALKLPWDERATILLIDRSEMNNEGGLQLPPEHPILFCGKLKKAQEYLLGKGLTLSAIQGDPGPQYFEIHDPDGNIIEICEEP